MTFLNTLSEDLQDLVIRLPYRVGYYISSSDQSGGSEAAQAEKEALSNVLTFYVEDTCKSEFAQEAMLETLNRQKEWESWSDNIQTVPEECLKLGKALVGRIDIKEIFAFQQNLLEIGVVVAQAYREFNHETGFVSRMQIHFALLVQRLHAALTGKEMASNDTLLNISREEKMALKLLADSLGVQFKV